MEFLLVGALLTVMTAAILQLGIALYVRNLATDAAIEGAYRAALADTTLDDGVAVTRQVLLRALGESFAADVSAIESDEFGIPMVTVTVRAPMPVLGLIGLPGLLEVEGSAPLSTLTIP